MIHLIVSWFFWALIISLFVNAILSWLPLAPGNPIVRFFNTIVRPIVAPLDRRIPRVGMISISYLLAFFVISFLRSLILYALPINW